MKFSELEILPVLKAAVEKLGYADLTPIQEASFPYIMSGKDIAGLAQTGTGKTAAFLIPLMHRILLSKELSQQQPPANSDPKVVPFINWQKRDFILVMVPTRELCEQVYKNFSDLRGDSGLRATTVYGGVGYDQQKKELAEPIEFVIATPGRLIDLYKEHVIDFRKIRAVVFDEADRMFDMGFKDDVRYVVQRVPKERQVLLFSATLNFEVLNIAYEMGSHPVEINLSRDQSKAENVKDVIYHVGNSDKPMYLLSLIKRHDPKQVIVFSNYKSNVERIADFLSSNGLPALGISSLLSQNQRNRVMEQFKAADNNKNILVATDLAARGLDIAGVDLVINFDLPEDSETYVHRIGRTGRAGKEGLALSLVSDDDVQSMERVESFLKHKLATEWLEEADMIKEFKPFPREKFRGNGQSRWTGGRDRGRPNRDEGRRDRPPRGRDRDREKNRRPRHERDDQRKEFAGGPGGESQHRDRISGRHGRRDEQQNQGRDERSGGAGGDRFQQRDKSYRRDRNYKGGRDRFDQNKKFNRGEYRGKSAAPVAQKSLGQKIKGFFSKLFKA
ncbi:MAG: hypothetical protein A4S09_00995 [Proteobacteria bacterium SG_bin7]|nr:MAG: hypothetical protein A4S09_00995 [Proteobacteria bacterium SG_bin7]